MPTFNPFSRFLKKPTLEKEVYLALTITSEKVLALIWSLENEEVKTLGFAQRKYQDLDNLAHQTAQAIDSSAEQAKSDVTKVVFGLSQNWFDNQELTKSANNLLENLSADLELESQAFVPLSVAVKNFLKAKEKITPQAILLGLFEKSCEAHLVKNNQIKNSTFSRNQPSPETVKQLINNLEEKESLPARLAIYGIKEDSGFKDKLNSAPLSSLFTQEPKIDFIDEETLALSVAWAQASDIAGHEIGLAPPAQDGNDQVKVPEPDEFGFVQDQDILKEDTAEEEEPQTAVSKEATEENLTIPLAHQNLKEGEKEEIITADGKSQKISLLEQIITLSWLDKLTSIFKKPGALRKIFIAALALILILFISSLVLAQTITKAEVTIKVKAQSQESNFTALVDAKGNSDFENHKIGGGEIESGQSGSQKAVTSGKKKSGEYAKGEVSVFNWTTSKISFQKGTIIISKDGIKFNLDSDVEVASRSASTPGQTKSPVIATEYGDKGNVSSGNDFSFQQYDELLYSARNDTAFTGGDEKEITVVSQNDMDKLEKSLLDSLKGKAVTDLKSANLDKIIHDDAIIIEIKSKNFDKKLDEEATLVNLDLEVIAKTVAYEKNSLTDFLAQVANQDAPQGLEARPKNIEILSSIAKSARGGLALNGRFRANYIPKLEEGQIKEKIANLSQKQAREKLKEISEVDDVIVDFSPSFLPRARIPKNKDRVTLKIETI